MVKREVAEIAARIDHALLHPTLNDADFREGCLLAKRWAVAAVCVKPYAVRDAVDLLSGSPVLVSAVAAFPHGNSATSVKVREAEQACEDGAREIDFVVNVGKVLSGDWTYVAAEVGAVNAAAVERGAITKVIFENAYYEDDAPIVRLCEICNEVGVAYVKTSTGFGFVPQPRGGYAAGGATEGHVRLMRKHARPETGVKASGGIRTLQDLIDLVALGVTRVGTSSTEVILRQAEKNFGNAQ